MSEEKHHEPEQIQSLENCSSTPSLNVAMLEQARKLLSEMGIPSTVDLETCGPMTAQVMALNEASKRLGKTAASLAESMSDAMLLKAFRQLNLAQPYGGRENYDTLDTLVQPEKPDAPTVRRLRKSERVDNEYSEKRVHLSGPLNDELTSLGILEVFLTQQGFDLRRGFNVEPITRKVSGKKGGYFRDWEVRGYSLKSNCIRISSWNRAVIPDTVYNHFLNFSRVQIGRVIQHLGFDVKRDVYTKKRGGMVQFGRRFGEHHVLLQTTSDLILNVTDESFAASGLTMFFSAADLSFPRQQRDNELDTMMLAYRNGKIAFPSKEEIRRQCGIDEGT